MVQIRYTQLPSGLHVATETRGRRVVIYLSPGLTTAQRRAALARVKSSARMGHGPRLTATSMTVAISADRIRTTTRNVGAATRVHPALLLPAVILLVSGLVLAVLLPLDAGTGHWPSFGSRAHDRVQQYHVPQLNLRTPAAAHSSRVAAHGRQVTGTAPRPTRQVPDATGPGQPGPDAPAPTPAMSTSPGPDPAVSPAPSPTPSPSPSRAICHKLGFAGQCLRV